MTESGSRLQRLRIMLFVGALALAGCSSPNGTGSAVNGISFTNPDSDVIAVLPAALAGDSTIVLLRGESAERARYVEFIDADGTWGEAVEDSNARLVELRLLDHRFAFSEYGPTDVMVTHYAPGGTTTSERIALGAEGEMVAAMPAALLGADGADDGAQQDASEQEFSDALRSFGDPSHYQRDWWVLRKAGEAAERKWNNLQKKIDRFRKGAEKLGTKIANELTCLTATRQLCAETTAAQAPQLASELQQLDPDAMTSAGFEVGDQGITPKRDEWADEFQRGTVPIGFTLTDVPCEKSVFADMNPDCPQYVPPATGSDGPTHGEGPGSDEPGSDEPGSDGPGSDNPGSGGPATGACTSGSLGNEDFSYGCDDWAEEYKAVLGGTLYLRFRDTTGEIRDQLSLNVGTDGGLEGYGINDYEYDAQGAFVRRESLTFYPLLDQSSRFVVTAVGGGDVKKESVDCNGQHSVRVATIGGENDLTAKQVLYMTADDNGTDCPTLDDVKALAKKVFPEADMTMEFVKSTQVYKDFTAAHP